MKMLETLKQNPKSADKLIQFYSDLMKGTMDDTSFTDEFKEFITNFNLEVDRIAEMISNAPRSAFDFFDDNNLIISTPVVWKNGSHSFLCELDGAPAAASFSTRKEAELYAVENAIVLLEGRLDS